MLKNIKALAKEVEQAALERGFTSVEPSPDLLTVTVNDQNIRSLDFVLRKGNHHAGAVSVLVKNSNVENQTVEQVTGIHFENETLYEALKAAGFTNEQQISSYSAEWLMRPFTDIRQGLLDMMRYWDEIQQKEGLMSDFWTKERLEFAADNRIFLPADSGYKPYADLNGAEARRYLESKGFEVVENRDTGRNGIAITKCGVYLSTNGYIHR